MKKTFKRVVIATLSLSIIMCLCIGSSKKLKAATFNQAETFYNEKYKELYTLYFGDVPPTLEIMIDIACNADHSLSIDQAINQVYLEMQEFYSLNKVTTQAKMSVKARTTKSSKMPTMRVMRSVWAKEYKKDMQNTKTNEVQP